MATGMYIAIVEDFKHTRKNRYLGTQEKVIKLYRSDLLLLKEDACILDVKHLNSLEDWEVENAVGSGYVSLLIVPLDLEGVLLFA